MTEPKQSRFELDECERKLEELLGARDLEKECEAEDRRFKEAMRELLGFQD